MKTYQPTHEEISQRAREIWSAEGQPSDRDNEIWLTAEQQLQTKGQGLSAPRTRASRSMRAKEQPSSLEEEADPINNDKLEERLAEFGAPNSRGATAL
jgi:hypothetical protein